MKKTTKNRVYTASVVLVVLLSSLYIFSGTTEAVPAWAYIHVEYENGEPVVGANVTLTNLATGASFYLITDSNGNCTFNPGIYEPGGLITNYGEILRVTATLGDYSDYREFTFSTDPSSQIKEWINITLLPPKIETIPLTTLLAVGLGSGISLLIIIMLLYEKIKEKKERTSNKGGKKRKQR